MSNFESRSRRLAREAYWEKHDRDTYECPDCGRTQGEIQGVFEVHHKNGEPMDNRPENQIALCRLCHNLREGKKPSLQHIERLRSELNSNTIYDDSNGQSVYLAGAMHRTKHDEWRASVADLDSSGMFTVDADIEINSPTEVTTFCHGIGPVEGIAKEDIDLLDDSDSILAYFEKSEQVGTLTELIYAVTKGMPALVLFDESLVELQDGGAGSDDISDGVENNHNSSTYWFLINFLANQRADVEMRVVNTNEDIRRAFVEWRWHDRHTRAELRGVSQSTDPPSHFYEAPSNTVCCGADTAFTTLHDDTTVEICSECQRTLGKAGEGQ